MEDNFILLENIYTKDSFRPLALLMTLLSLAPDCKPAPILPNIQSGKYNEMDPILIGTGVFEHVIKEMSKPAVPLVKVV